MLGAMIGINGEIPVVDQPVESVRVVKHVPQHRSGLDGETTLFPQHRLLTPADEAPPAIGLGKDL
jgi:hypothetical protein